MKRFIAVFALCACATTPAPAADTVTERQPPLLSTPEPQRAGFYPLPKALQTDPRSLEAKPFELSIPTPQKETLANGLTIYLLEDHAAPLVNLRALVAGGAAQDPANLVGRAQLAFSALATGGTQSKTPDELDELLSFHAADLGAGADDEYGTVMLNLRSKDLPTLLPVFAEVLLKPRFDTKRLEIDKASALEAIRRRPDRADGLAARALSKALYGPTSLLGRETTPETVKAVTVAELKRFHAASVSPKGTALLVSGDFSTAELLPKLKALFGAWQGPERVKTTFPAGEARQRRVIVVPKQTAQAKVRIGGVGYPRRSPLEYPMRLVSTSLGAFGVGRLYREIRDERGLAYSAHASVGTNATTGQFTASFDCDPKKTSLALDEALKQLTLVSSTAPTTAAELKTAGDMAVNSFAFRFDSAARIVWERAVLDFFGYPDDYLQQYRGKVAAVTEADALAAAKLMTEPSTMQIVVVGPVEQLGDLSRFGPVTVVNDVDAFR